MMELCFMFKKYMLHVPSIIYWFHLTIKKKQKKSFSVQIPYQIPISA